MNCFYTSPQSFLNLFLFVSLTTLGTFIVFNWLIHQVECPNVSTTHLQKGQFRVSSLVMYINLLAIVLSL